MIGGLGMNQIDIKDASVNIIIEVDGKLYVAAYDNELFETISYVVKNGLEHLIKTDKTQQELIEFVGMDK